MRERCIHKSLLYPFSAGRDRARQRISALKFPRAPAGPSSPSQNAELLYTAKAINQ